MLFIAPILNVRWTSKYHIKTSSFSFFDTSYFLICCSFNVLVCLCICGNIVMCISVFVYLLRKRFIVSMVFHLRSCSWLRSRAVFYWYAYCSCAMCMVLYRCKFFILIYKKSLIANKIMFSWFQRIFIRLCECAHINHLYNFQSNLINRVVFCAHISMYVYRSYGRSSFYFFFFSSNHIIEDCALYV